jgi:chromosome segregation ATPase
MHQRDFSCDNYLLVVWDSNFGPQAIALRAGFEQRAQHISSQTRIQATEEQKEFGKHINSAWTEKITQKQVELGAMRNQLDLQKKRYESQLQDATNEANAQRQQLETQLAEQSQATGQMIEELDEQIREKTETLSQTRLALNRSRNELIEEKRKASLTIQESATKGQQLEFVQQQCAVLQTQLGSTTTPQQANLEGESRSHGN